MRQWGDRAECGGGTDRGYCAKRQLGNVWWGDGGGRTERDDGVEHDGAVAGILDNGYLRSVPLSRVRQTQISGPNGQSSTGVPSGNPLR